MSGGHIRVALVDDQELIRAGLAMVVGSADDLEVVVQAGDGRQALAALRATRADVVLMDVRMPVLDGVETTRLLLAEQPQLKVLVLTTFDLDEHAFPALRAGASGFLLKDVPAEELLRAIRTVHAGDAVIAPSTTRRLLEQVAPRLPGAPTSKQVMAPLTDREREVMLQLATGASNAEIAGRLFLSEATVKTHVGRVLTKLGLRDRVQAVVLAYETGLITPSR